MTSGENLHGNDPDRSRVALLLVDVINDLEFEEGEQLLAAGLPMARRLAALKQRAQQARVPVIYVNDNFGRWRSDFRRQVRHCLEDDVCGAPIAQLLPPAEEDYFVLKPKHSGFFGTTLDTLLEHLHVEAVIVTGIATNICVFFTASDAYIRGYQVFVPADCVAAGSAEETRYSLRQMEKILDADIRPATELDLVRMRAGALRRAG